VDKNWAVPGRFFQSLPVPCGDKQGRAARAAAAGAGRQFFKKIIFIIEHIKKTRIFLKKKINK
jgi:hypothetical protein